MKTLIYISILFFIVSCAQEKSSCSDFHIGNFEYINPEYEHIKIIRTRDSQIEINTKSKIEAHTSVQWLSTCKYVLTYKYFKNAPEEFDDLIGQKVQDEITQIAKDRFTCEVKSKATSDFMEFRVIKNNQK